jgi:hypothetical protein
MCSVSAWEGGLGVPASVWIATQGATKLSTKRYFSNQLKLLLSELSSEDMNRTDK